MGSRRLFGALIIILALTLAGQGTHAPAFADTGLDSPVQPTVRADAPAAITASTVIDSRRTPFILGQPRRVPPFPIVLNQSVQRHVNEFVKHPAGLRLCFERSDPYFSEMVRILRSHSLPDDLIYLAFAESAFSYKGRGPWQFSAPTARRYGLRIDSWLDERRDPILSTKAAARHLAELHDAAGRDWWVALVGWNIGESAIGRYRALSGREYTKFASSLPRRTRALLGRFMAVAFISQNARSYGIGPVRNREALICHTVSVEGGTTLATVARRHGTSVARLKELNPALLRDSVPRGIQSYEIRVPLFESASATF